jgi:hypothetical protein
MKLKTIDSLFSLKTTNGSKLKTLPKLKPSMVKTNSWT